MNRENQPVVWSEGMPMWPHHLQQSDRHTAALVNERLGALSPPAWGLLELRFSAQQLAEGRVALECLRAVLPDGTPLRLGSESGTAPPSRALASWTDKTRTRGQVVFVVLPQSQPGRSNYRRAAKPPRSSTDFESTESQKAAHAVVPPAPTDDQRAASAPRYLAHWVAVPDLTGCSEPVQMELAVPNAFLAFDDEASAYASRLPLARLVPSAGGGAAVDPSFVPPFLSLDATPGLRGSLEQLIERLEARMVALAAARREHSSGSIAVEQSDLTRFLLLQSIASYLPRLRSVARGDRSHRDAVYRVLSDFAGDLAPFSSSFLWREPVCDLSSLSDVFATLLARLDALLIETSRERFAELAFEAHRDGMHMAKLDGFDPRSFRAHLLGVSSDMPGEQVRELLPGLGKMASWRAIHALVQSATPGIALQALREAPAEIPARANETYFRIETTNQYWREICSEGSAAVFLPAPFLPDQTRVRILGLPKDPS